MHHSKGLAFTFIMILIVSRCTVWVKYYSTLHTTGLFLCYRIIIYLNLNLSSPASLKPQNKTALYFYFLLLIMSSQMKKKRLHVVSIQYLKHNAQFI